MASSDDSVSLNGTTGGRRRHPAYELHRSCDRDTNVTNMTGDSMGSISDDKEEGDYVLAPDLAERLVKRTEVRVSQVVASSSYVQKNCTLYQLPRFDREDFVMGELIAFGGFSNVYAIDHFTVESELTEEQATRIKQHESNNTGLGGGASFPMACKCTRNQLKLAC